MREIEELSTKIHRDGSLIDAMSRVIAQAIELDDYLQLRAQQAKDADNIHLHDLAYSLADQVTETLKAIAAGIMDTGINPLHDRLAIPLLVDEPESVANQYGQNVVNLLSEKQLDENGINLRNLLIVTSPGRSFDIISWNPTIATCFQSKEIDGPKTFTVSLVFIQTDLPDSE